MKEHRHSCNTLKGPMISFLQIFLQPSLCNAYTPLQNVWHGSKNVVTFDMFELRFDAKITIQTCQLFGIAATVCKKHWI